MRPLVRPCLFAVVRLSILISVVAALYGPDRSTAFSIGGRSFICGTNRHEIWLATHFIGEHPGGTPTVTSLPGLWFSSSDNGFQTRVSYVFIVAVFVLFYAALKWIYRKHNATDNMKGTL